MRTFSMFGCVVVMLFCCLGLARADAIYLKSGGKLEGEVKQTDKGVVVTSRFGTVTVPKAEVLRIEKSKTVEQVYKEKAAQLKPDDADGHCQLGRWLDSKSWSDRARVHYERAIQIDPNHEAARKALGYAFCNNAWHTEDKAMQLMGMVKYKGKWTPVGEVKRLALRKARLAAEREFRRELKENIRLAKSPHPFERSHGREALKAMAEKYNCPKLRGLAERLAELGRSRAWAHMEIDLAQIDMVEMKNFNFQTTQIPGQPPVRTTIQQPTTQATRVQTNVTASGK